MTNSKLVNKKTAVIALVAVGAVSAIVLTAVLVTPVSAFGPRPFWMYGNPLGAFGPGHFGSGMPWHDKGAMSGSNWSWHGGKMEGINVTGSANLGEAVKNFIEENRDVSFSAAATTAEQQSNNTRIVVGHFGVVQGYLVYSFIGVDNEQQEISKLIVDAADGTVLYKSDPFQMNGHGKFYPANVTAKLDLSEAAVKAQGEVENGVADMGMLRVQDDKPVYVFLVTDGEQATKQFVTVDANSGEVLEVSEGMSGGFYGKHFGSHGYGKGWHGPGHGWYGHGYEDWADKDLSGSDANSETGSQA